MFMLIIIPFGGRGSAVNSLYAILRMTSAEICEKTSVYCGTVLLKF